MVDFAKLKERVNIEKILPMIGLEKLDRTRTGYRGGCPLCGDPRTFTITPAKNLFGCFHCNERGDMIKLVSLVHKVSLPDAAVAIEKFVGGTQTIPHSATRPQPVPERKAGFDAAAYAARVDAAHEALAPLGVSPETFKAFSAGYMAGGINRGKLAMPLHDRAGQCVAYFGRTLKGESPSLFFPNGVNPGEFIFNAHKVEAGELYLVRDPLQVLTAYEGGITNCVAFLCPITAQMLEMLASLMDDNKIETVELY